MGFSKVPKKFLLKQKFKISHNFVALKAEVEHENMRLQPDFKVSQKAVGWDLN